MQNILTDQILNLQTYVKYLKIEFNFLCFLYLHWRLLIEMNFSLLKKKGKHNPVIMSQNRKWYKVMIPYVPDFTTDFQHTQRKVG